jgi:hypothetical protein
MTNAQIETWALRAIDTMMAGGQDEVSHVEMKGKWPEGHASFARQLAGQANAARGQPIIWIIGPDAKEKKLNSAPKEELANWWPQVKKHFDDAHAPSLVAELAVQTLGESVVVLCFETDRPPYVIKKGDFKEVPWREGTGTASAGRQQLLRVLAPLVLLPTFEETGGAVGLRDDSKERKGFHVFGRLHTTVLPHNNDVIYIARHRCRLRVRFPNVGLVYDVPVQFLGYSDNDYDESDEGETMLKVEGPLRFWVFGRSEVDAFPNVSREEVPEVDLTVGVTTTVTTTTITAFCPNVMNEYANNPSRDWQT